VSIRDVSPVSPLSDFAHCRPIATSADNGNARTSRLWIQCQKRDGNNAATSEQRKWCVLIRDIVSLLQSIKRNKIPFLVVQVPLQERESERSLKHRTTFGNSEATWRCTGSRYCDTFEIKVSSRVKTGAKRSHGSHGSHFQSLSVTDVTSLLMMKLSLWTFQSFSSYSVHS